MRTHGAVVGRRFRSVTKLTTKVRTGVRGYLWVIFLIAAAALKTPTRNGYNAQGVNLNICLVRVRVRSGVNPYCNKGWTKGNTTLRDSVGDEEGKGVFANNRVNPNPSQIFVCPLHRPHYRAM